MKVEHKIRLWYKKGRLEFTKSRKYLPLSIISNIEQVASNQGLKKGHVYVTLDKERTYPFTLEPTTSGLLMRAAGVDSGSDESGHVWINGEKVEGPIYVSSQDIKTIARLQLNKLKTRYLEKAYKCIAGTCKSLGFEIDENKEPVLI